MDEDYQRKRRRLIEPRLQLPIIASFVGLLALAASFQVILLSVSLDLAFPQGSAREAVGLGGVLLRTLAVTLVVWTPLLVGVGILLTHRIAGPIHHCVSYLADVARGEELGPCRLREGDDLEELAERINAALDHLRLEKRRSALANENEAA